MRHLVRNLLAMLGGSVLIAACSGLNGLSGDQYYEDAQYLRRWKVVDASGSVLSEGCAQEPQSTTNSDDWGARIKVHASAGSIVTDQDNLGSQRVSKGKSNKQFPTSDAYWCSDQDTTQVAGGVYGLATLHVVGTDPPATLQSVDLVNPRKDSYGDVLADEVKVRLQILHPGVLHLGYSISLESSDAGADGSADAGQIVDKTYAAMTIE